MHYRETIVWNKAMDIAQSVYRLAPLLPKAEIYGVRSQITRAAVSVPCNIAEGWSRETAKDKGHFLAIAQGSTAELETLVTLCEQIGWFKGENTKRLRQLLEEVSRMLTVLRRRHRPR
jgi:four helix bundle protein